MNDDREIRAVITPKELPDGYLQRHSVGVGDVVVGYFSDDGAFHILFGFVGSGEHAWNGARQTLTDLGAYAFLLEAFLQKKTVIGKLVQDDNGLALADTEEFGIANTVGEC